MSPSLYRRITGFVVWPLVLIVVTGAAVRLTGSGLGCSDWPNCSASQFVPASGFHAWMEFGNRLITAAVSVAVIVAVLTALLRTPRRRDLTWLSAGLVVGVIAQILLGAAVVIMDLNPVMVQGHFIVSQLLVLDAVVLHHRAGRPDEATAAKALAAPAEPIVAADIRLLAKIMVGLTAAVILVGTGVTGAGPHSGQNNGKFVRRLDIAVRDIARIHSALVWLLLGAVAFTVWRLRKSDVPGAVVQRAELVLTAVVLQGVIGYTQYFTGVPPLLVGLHVLGASLLWMAVLYFLLGLSATAIDPRRSVDAVDSASTRPGANRSHAYGHPARGAGTDLVTDR